MRRNINMIVIVLSVVLLSGCSILGSRREPDNPLSGRSTDERIILALEKVYYEHKFTTIKPYGKQEDGKKYAVCADENGVEFKVTGFLYNNIFHFGCEDGYCAAILRKNNFLERAKEIANRDGYQDVTLDEETQGVSINVTISDWNRTEFEKVIGTLVKMIDITEEIPKRAPIRTGFSTGKVNYYTLPTMTGVCVHFLDEKGEQVDLVFVYYTDRGKTVEQLMDERIREQLAWAYENWKESTDEE